MNRLIKTLAAFTYAAASLFVVNTSNATVYSGTFGATGYETINFSVSSTQTVNFLYTGGFGDPSFSLFNASGNHLITNDDTAAYGLYSHLTQTLTAGNYSLLVGACCSFYGAGANIYTTTDGFNSGSYYTGNTTLANMQAYFDANNFGRAAGTAYTLNVSNNVNIGQSNSVPTPATGALLLTGLGLIGFTARRRKTL